MIALHGQYVDARPVIQQIVKLIVCDTPQVPQDQQIWKICVMLYNDIINTTISTISTIIISKQLRKYIGQKHWQLLQKLYSWHALEFIDIIRANCLIIEPYYHLIMIL